jgi:hypothetical protein
MRSAAPEAVSEHDGIEDLASVSRMNERI